MIKKNLFLLAVFFTIAFNASSQAIMNCANFCVLSINNLDTTANTIDVAILNNDTIAVNYPLVVVVNSIGDTVINKSLYYSLFTDNTQDTTVQTLSTNWDSIPTGFTGTVYLTDQVWDTTCAFSYPMTCTLGINELATTNEFHVFPNPASDVINFRLPKHVNSAEINLYDLTGRKVRSLITAENSISVSRDDLPTGIYLAELVFGERRITKKIVLK